jgi:amyloid beta precursor protein binding protein 1
MSSMAVDNSMAAVASTSRPSAHTQRYDRQLRLWASSGQASLESAKILVLGASHLGACVLKNLILPGIGSFTLVDGCSVGRYDLGNNFFVASDSKGQSRAKEVQKNLCELNPSVKGRTIAEDPLSVCSKTSLEDYSLVIAVNQPHRVLLPLADKLWTANEGAGIPLMALRAAGFVGEVQVQVKESAGEWRDKSGDNSLLSVIRQSSTHIQTRRSTFA